jgi:hypothetical protein
MKKKKIFYIKKIMYMEIEKEEKKSEAKSFSAVHQK